ncbi:mucin-associated surface protein (MASP), putative [Trypanosoma cruzi marinkellei]|uniref:Mucin-associated surface protein (MASP), putative n=1 Tax=Trypanosoma cruzi marinkellei TaxID=85056 RepID=K2MU99_TRYCR|nr:mucin-associated surface protein (MASP), putative [Trypanosoma cruzi marinkellei]
MAMMMTGRVLLACALCVLWCGAAGGRCEGDATLSAGSPAAPASDGKIVQEPSRSVEEGLNKSVLESLVAEEQAEETHKEDLSAEDETPSSEGSSEEEEEIQQASAQEETSPSSPLPSKPQGGGTGGPPQQVDKKLEKVNESGLQPENQRQVKEGQETVVDVAAKVTKGNEGSGLQAQLHETLEKEEDTRNGEGISLTQGTEQHVNVEEITPRNPAGDHSLGEHKGSDGSKEEEDEEGEGDEDATSERVLAGGQEKINSTSGPEEVLNKTNTEGTQTPGDSDSSTAVSPATSFFCFFLCVRLRLRWWPRENEGARAVHRPHTHSSFSLCVCPLAWTLALTSPHDART